MSDTDPYAAPENEPTVEEADFENDADVYREEPDVEVSAAPHTEVPTAPEGSVKDVLAWVGDDPEKAQAALDAEKAGEQRSTLISKLENIIH
jgi:hypothetical protein